MDTIEYHDATKHHFGRFARALGYLDWATQPNPFRRFAGAPATSLPRETSDRVGEFLRCSMGLSAWKTYRATSWALRVNPSSGNLHPTEAYVVIEGQVAHYAPEGHALEERAVLAPEAWSAFVGDRRGFLVGLTSVHWREAWKYGERAFRYCQHDVGHAVGALRYAAALHGWTLALLPLWADDDIAAVLGLDRDEDFGDAEREAPACVAVVTQDDAAPWLETPPAALVEAARVASWAGSANRLSPTRVEWPAIDRVAEATRYDGRHGVGSHAMRTLSRTDLCARDVILRRRSAVAFDGRSALPREAFFAMLARLSPARPPWDALHWPPQIHLVLFIHRVEGLTPGIYAALRDPGVRDDWRAAMRPAFLWEPATAPGGSGGSTDPNGLYLLLPSNVTRAAQRLSCDQDIAADGFFSLGMLARFEPALRERGEWFYRRLFWECGLLGQVLYLEAEGAGARGTGIGCFYDDAVHDTLGLMGHDWQSLYHFSMGVPVDDARLTTRPGYDWEA